MLSEKLQSLVTLLDLAAHGVVLPNRAVLKTAHRVASDLQEQIKALEAAQIPRRQRVTDADFSSGKIMQFPIVPRNEGLRP